MKCHGPGSDLPRASSRCRIKREADAPNEVGVRGRVRGRGRRGRLQERLWVELGHLVNRRIEPLGLGLEFPLHHVEHVVPPAEQLRALRTVVAARRPRAAADAPQHPLVRVRIGVRIGVRVGVGVGVGVGVRVGVREGVRVEVRVEARLRLGLGSGLPRASPPCSAGVITRGDN